MTIHPGHPFAQPEDARDQVRRLRGRLGGAVSLWTSGTGAARAGLTVSSVMIAAGEPGRVLGLIDPDSALVDTLAQTHTAVVALLEWPHRNLADAFAGVAPAPGGLFAQAAFAETAWGPLLEGVRTWAGVRVEEVREVGWSQLVTATIEQVSIGPEERPLEHRRGRYQEPTAHK
ncbi:flavin reductase family protein [Nocardioides dubius]|uniref:Flavin reductase like domain-containing protein n=1 Tax=Nocardioides dubius TaxID=317019 RepID=A0ABN1TNG8_9ACTN